MRVTCLGLPKILNPEPWAVPSTSEPKEAVLERVNMGGKYQTPGQVLQTCLVGLNKASHS